MSTNHEGYNKKSMSQIKVCQQTMKEMGLFWNKHDMKITVNDKVNGT